MPALRRLSAIAETFGLPCIWFGRDRPVRAVLLPPGMPAANDAYIHDPEAA